MSSIEDQMQKKSMLSPEETVNMEKGKFEFVNIGKLRVARFTFEPGWTWERFEKPLFNTESCQLTHQGYLISGRLVVRMVDSGKEIEYRPGDLFYIPPGHDGRVVGSEPVVGLDISNGNTK
jgi:mannose-6-phosphate isomerase-like protein (cupin superfamily)